MACGAEVFISHRFHALRRRRPAPRSIRSWPRAPATQAPRGATNALLPELAGTLLRDLIVGVATSAPRAGRGLRGVCADRARAANEGSACAYWVAARSCCTACPASSARRGEPGARRVVAFAGPVAQLRACRGDSPIRRPFGVRAAEEARARSAARPPSVVTASRVRSSAMASGSAVERHCP